MFLDPRMDDRIITIGAFVTIGLVILALVIAYLLHVIPLM